MNNSDILRSIAGGLQLIVAIYALRLNRLFGTARVGWLLFSAFALLALLHLTQSMNFMGAGGQGQIEVEVTYSLVSMLLLVGLVHIEALLKEKLQRQREEERVHSELEFRVTEKTADLIKANEELQRQIEERLRLEKQAEKAHQELLAASRQAGMAEMAARVFQQVGAMLDNLDISANLVSDDVQQSKIANVVRLGTLLHEHSADMADFLARDPRGQRLPLYLAQLAEHLAKEQTALSKRIESLKKDLEQIKQVVAVQQGCVPLPAETPAEPAKNIAPDVVSA